MTKGGYRKHFAYFHDEGIMDSWLCICDRVTNHMVDRPGSARAEPTLFELSTDGEMRA